MDTAQLISAGFWESDEHFVSADFRGDLPELPNCRGGVVFKTSGSTGEGKWVVLEKKALLHSAGAVNDWLKVCEASRWGLALPSNHVGGFSIFARCFLAGCELSRFDRKWKAVDFAERVGGERVTHASLVPTQVHDLVAERLKAPTCLQALVVGGGRLASETGQAARDLGWPVLASYGMTEAGSQVATQALDALEKPFVDGALELLPIWEARVSEEGLMELRGAALFSGTIDGERFQRREPEWFTTNDRVTVSGRTVVPLGRADSLVKVMGELVDVGVVERRLCEIAGGSIPDAGVVVIAMPDARSEHKLVVVFEGEVRADCVEDYNRQASGVERIAEVFVVAEISKSSLGKVRRGVLADTLKSLAPSAEYPRPLRGR